MKINITELKNHQTKILPSFAKPIWYEHYTPIIGEKQVTYMLEKFQSFEAILKQIEDGYQYFQVTCNTKLVGYFSLQMRKNASLFISKFYLSKETRGQGVGTKILSFIEQLATTKKCVTIDLTVNKFNPAYKVYLKLGFIKKGEEKFDIGEGYIMDDYLMSKNLS